MQLDFVYKVYQIYNQNYPDKKKLIAVSFGQDSIILLIIIFFIQNIFKESTFLIHCNHFYQKDNFYIIKEGFKISYLLNTNLFISCPINCQTSETKQRIWRHRIFKRTANLLQCDSIYIGHTKTDKIETFLFNLIRGSNLLSTSNFTFKNSQFVHDCFTNSMNKLKLNKFEKINFYRPLLSFSRQELKILVKNNKIPNIMDSSNLDTKFSRNKIRLLLLPLLKLYFNKNIETQFERALIQAEIDNFYLQNQVSQILKKRTQITKSEFKKLPKSVQLRFLKQIVKFYSGKDVNFNLITKLQTKI
jgi:tRNA(Ile)-lysidine synthase